MSTMIESAKAMLAMEMPPREKSAVYVAEGDCLVYFDRDEPYHRMRLDGDVTIYVSDANPDLLVGCQLKDFAKHLRRYGEFGVQIGKGGRMQLGMLFVLSGVLPETSDQTRGLFDSELARREIDVPELCEA